MRKSITALFATTVAISAFALSPGAKEGKKAGSVVLIPFDDVKWNSVPDSPGVMMAALEGDPAKGTSHFMIKLQDGFSAPLHHHSSDHFVTVVSGTLVLTVDGKETKLPAGSYFQFKGKMDHLTRAEPGADCVLSVDVRGKWDMVPVEAHPVSTK
jgi:quercetin dioxygenase-like cupin family protein